MNPAQGTDKGTDRGVSVLIQYLQDDQITGRSNSEIFRTDGMRRCDFSADMGSVSGIVIGQWACMDKVFKMQDTGRNRSVRQRQKIGTWLNAGIQNSNGHTTAIDMTVVCIVCFYNVIGR